MMPHGTFRFMLWLFAAGVAHAQNPVPGSSFDDVERIFNNLVTMLWVVLIAAATIYFILAGFKYLSAQGNAETVRKANKMMLYGMIALAIGLVARGVIFLVEDIVCGGGLNC